MSHHRLIKCALSLFMLMIVSFFIFFGWSLFFSGWLDWFALPSRCLHKSLTVTSAVFIHALLLQKAFLEMPVWVGVFLMWRSTVCLLPPGMILHFNSGYFCLNASYDEFDAHFPLFHLFDFLLYASKYIKVL